jgi:hypothetical protein
MSRGSNSNSGIFSSNDDNTPPYSDIFGEDLEAEPSEAKEETKLPDPGAVIEILNKAGLDPVGIAPSQRRLKEDLYNPHIEKLLENGQTSCLDTGERKIFALCSDGFLRVGSRNPKYGNRNLTRRNETAVDTLNYLKHIPQEQWLFTDPDASSGHPTLLIHDGGFDGQAYCGGWFIKRLGGTEEYIEVLFQSGRLTRAFNEEQMAAIKQVMETILNEAYGPIKVVIHENYSTANSKFWKRSVGEDKGSTQVQTSYAHMVSGTLLIAITEKAIEKHKEYALKEAKHSFFHKHNSDGIEKNQLLLSQLQAKKTDFGEMLSLFRNYFNDVPLAEEQKIKCSARSNAHSFISFFLNELSKETFLTNLISVTTYAGDSGLRLNQILDNQTDFTAKSAEKSRKQAFQYFKTMTIQPIYKDTERDILLNRPCR